MKGHPYFRWGFVTGLLVLFFPQILFALPPSPHEPLVQAGIAYTFRGDAELEHSDGTQVDLLEFDFWFPFYTGAKGAYRFFAGMRSNSRYFDFNGPYYASIDVYSLQIPLTMMWQANGRSVFQLTLAPGIFSDFNDVSGDDFNVPGGIYYNYELGPKQFLVIGAAYGQAFGEDQVYPVGGLKWTASDKLHVNLMFPNPSATWRWTPDLLLYLFVEPGGNEWNVELFDGQDADFEFESWQTGAGLEFRLGQHLWIGLSGGAEIGRHIKLDLYDAVDADLEDTWFIRAGLSFR